MELLRDMLGLTEQQQVQKVIEWIRAGKLSAVLGENTTTDPEFTEYLKQLKEGITNA